MQYWIYENWTAESKALIHRGTCGYCQDGKGCHSNPLGKANGQWLGSFDTLEEARQVANLSARPVKEHSCVLNSDSKLLSALFRNSCRPFSY